MILNRYVVCFLFFFGLLVDNIASYYSDLFLLYVIVITNNYLKVNNKILCNYPYSKLFLIWILDFATLPIIK